MAAGAAAARSATGTRGPATGTTSAGRSTGTGKSTGKGAGKDKAAGGTAAGGGGKRTGRQRRRRWLAIAGGTVLGLFVLLAVFVGVVYASTDIPDISKVQNAQTTVLYYADGTTEMARLGSQNRTNVPLSQVSEPARNAVLAAENRNFYSDPGVSFVGIARAAYNNVTGGSTQGGSTITQQYVKNAFLTSEQTFSRKFQELFLAVKLDNNYSKDQILENYLNTIYFGRGAYGVEAAANTYFGVPASKLTAEQGAVLAVLIRNPSAYDPANDQASAQDRWGKVLDAMAQKGWLDGAQRAAATYPQVLPPPESSSLGIPSGPEGLAVQQAITELKGKGYPDDQIRAGGLRITTTVDKKAQDAAIAAVKDVMAGEPGGLRQALVAVDPKNGAVRAYYGGDKGAGSGIIDYAQARRAPGSSMKPYTLATALQQGISVNARRDGSSPQTFPDRPGKPVRNASNAQCAACSLREAITRSLNTTFYGLAYEVGADKVRDTALAATGMPDTWPKVGSSLDGLRTLSSPENGATGASIGIGEYEMRPIDQAIGFATFADGGVHHDPHFVEKVTDNEGNGLYALQDQGKQVVPSDVAHDVTYALEGVAAYSHRSLDGGRETASKTGTQGLNDNDNSDAWMVGYTPSISAAVWMGNDSPNQPIVNSSGRIVYGSGLPGAIWQEFMDSVLAGTPEEALPDRPLITGDTGKSVPLPVTTTTRVPDATTSRAPRTTTAAPRTTTAAPATTSEAPATTTQARPSPSSSPSSTAEDGSVAPGVPGFPSRGRGGTQTDDTQLAPAG